MSWWYKYNPLKWLSRSLVLMNLVLLLLKILGDFIREGSAEMPVPFVHAATVRVSNPHFKKGKKNPWKWNITVNFSVPEGFLQGWGWGWVWGWGWSSDSTASSSNSPADGGGASSSEGEASHSSKSKKDDKSHEDKKRD